MSDPLVDALRDSCTGEVHAGRSLAEFTTLRVGGDARALVIAEDDADLAAIGVACTQAGAPWMVVGRGSNLLVADDGWHGVAIQLGRAYRGTTIEVPDEPEAAGVVRVGGAEPLPTLAVRVAAAGLTGFAWAVGVPGTLGGAVRMNAGAHGGDMADALTEVELFRLRSGGRETWPASALELRYRHATLPEDAVVVGATLSLERGEESRVREEMAQIRDWRREHQPLSEPNCGSVFTNPPGDSAGRLVEAVGAKGLTIGGASVSTTHANFIVTRPGATATDVHELIEHVIAQVASSTGVRLVPEVSRVGNFPPVDTS
ncbi:MAG: UDP-N-acetylmuramate dehydrogenase [Nitriliruptoraceae bacterium]|nr:UDP-N-acetylmuramate dehydrogenase [Nitriliruptoraceae bacterium]